MSCDCKRTDINESEDIVTTVVGNVADFYQLYFQIQLIPLHCNVGSSDVIRWDIIAPGCFARRV